MSSSVVGKQLDSALHIDLTLNALANQIKLIWNNLINLVEYALSYLDHVNDVHLTEFLNLQLAEIVGLSTGRWVEGRLIKNDQISSILHLHVGIDSDDLGIKVLSSAVIVVEVLRLLQMNRVVQDFLGSFACTLLHLGDLIVQVSWNGQL